MSCLNEDTILRFVQGELTGEPQIEVAQHLDTCGDCRGAVAQAARMLFSGAPSAAHGVASDEPVKDDPPALSPGMRISRYEILGVVGVGGAGVIYRAYDTDLHRPVALKLIRPDISRSGSNGAENRLLLEARAMARLSHPNVVNVYDAAAYEKHVFVVMELVEGTTLAAWLRPHPRAWNEVMDMFLQAGRGLAAAHAAGLVHRDFKPENVLVGNDGRPRVADFGLARRFETPLSGDPGEVAGFAGTPAYMAPEQFLGRQTDARTDQFSFCVALHLALYGRHPFGLHPREREPILNLAAAVVAGRLCAPPAATPVPRTVYQVIRRGLSATPDERYPSFDAFLTALDKSRMLPPLRRAARVLIPSLAVLAGIAGLWLGTGRRGAVFPEGRCGDGVPQAGESCDDGNAADTDACLTSCRFAKCGDGKVRARVEDCDDGNRIDGDGCSAGCLACQAGDTAFVLGGGGACYTRHDSPMNWDEARRRCAAIGGDLAALTTTFETRAVFAALVQERPARPWIGFFDLGHDGSFEWVSGEPAGVLKGREAPVEPTQEALRCAALSAGRVPADSFIPIHFVRTDCESRAPALCERPPWQVRPKDNHAFFAVWRPASWNHAQDDCAARGAHLVTVADEEESTFVAAQIPFESWIGARDQKGDGGFRWVNGEPFVFRGFVAGEPDEPGSSDCVLLGPQKGWHDRRCAELHPYVCEID